MSHEPGIDGRGLFVLAWCSCGWNRTKATRGTAQKAINEHVQWNADWERRAGWGRGGSIYLDHVAAMTADPEVLQAITDTRSEMDGRERNEESQ